MSSELAWPEGGMNILESKCEFCMKECPKEKSIREKLKQADEALRRVQSILNEPLIIEENGVLRPVKRTSRQDVYKAILAAQKAAGVTGRWFPEWMKEE